MKPLPIVLGLLGLVALVSFIVAGSDGEVQTSQEGGSMQGLVQVPSGPVEGEPVTIQPDSNASTLLENSPSAQSPATTEIHDSIRYHYAFFDRDGRMLFSSRAEDLPEMEQTREEFEGDYTVPHHPPGGSPEVMPVRQGSFLGLIGDARIDVGTKLLGRAVGDLVEFPVEGHFPGYEETIRLEKRRGPFDLEMNVSTEFLDNVTSHAQGESILIDDLLPATILARTDSAATIRFDVQTGDVLPVRRAGFQAEVIVDQESRQFYLLLDTQEGHKFSLSEKCKISSYVISRGSYRVVAEDMETIQLERSRMPWPQLMDRDGLTFFMEITKIIETK